MNINYAHRLYFVWSSDSNDIRDLDSNWKLIIVEKQSSSIYFLDPRNPNRNNDEEIVNCCSKVADLLRYLRITDRDNNVIQDWTVTRYPFQYYQSYDSNGFNGGLYILIILYFIVYDSPIYFSEHQLQNFRRKFCYWVLKGKLPI